MTPAQTLENKQFRAALYWAVFGIAYNLVEGVVSIAFGVSDDALTLLGFGVDSFIEAISAVGIAVMVLRIGNQPDSPRGKFESSALTITGWCFYMLAASLLVGAGLKIWQGADPQSTLPGVVISSISIAVMWIMLRAKLQLGRQLGSDAIVADAKCTQICIYMSLVLLASSAFYELTHLGFVDALGALGLAYFSYREGTEALDKAAGKHTCDHC